MQAFHGGEFWSDYGSRFERFSKSDAIPADVLDAWFPPAPSVVQAVTEEFPRLARTSPPSGCEGLIETIAATRGVPCSSIAVGAGSSALIYQMFPRLLSADKAALLYDPIYGEYPHVCKLIGAQCLYVSSLEDLEAKLSSEVVLAVLVNPVNPTGKYLPPDQILALVTDNPRTTFWVDEAYLEYVPECRSLEVEAAQRDNLIVCKSLSKIYALSGMRVAYAVADPRLIEYVRTWTPPWVIGTAAQLAAIRALESPDYYRVRYRETRALRADLAQRFPFGTRSAGHLNAILVELANVQASEIVAAARGHGVYIRNAGTMSPSFEDRFIRVAVRSPEEIERVLEVMERLVPLEALPSGVPTVL